VLDPDNPTVSPLLEESMIDVDDDGTDNLLLLGLFKSTLEYRMRFFMERAT
jgi:hypothetical protein